MKNLILLLNRTSIFQFFILLVFLSPALSANSTSFICDGLSHDGDLIFKKKMSRDAEILVSPLGRKGLEIEVSRSLSDLHSNNIRLYLRDEVNGTLYSSFHGAFDSRGMVEFVLQIESDFIVRFICQKN